MSVLAPPKPPDADERSLEERVAELEALIEEARRRARRRRLRNGAVVLLVVLAAVAATYAGGGGVRVGTGRSADASAPRSAVHAQQIGRWSMPSGPLPGSWLSSIVVDPRSSANVYAAAGGRVFRSSDGGRSWTGGLQIDPRVDTLAIDPQRPSVIYAGAGAGVFKSVDAGRDWTFSGLGLTPRKPGGLRGEGDIGALIVDPTDSSVVYAVAGITRGHVSKSIDGGRTWRTLAASPSSISALTLDPANPQTVFAAVEGPYTNHLGHSSISMTTDGGATWRTVLHQDGNLWAIAVDPAGTGTVYAIGTAGVVVTRDNGVTWAAVKAPAVNLLGLAIDPRDAETVYVASWQKGVFKTTDGGHSWSNLGMSLGGPITLDARTPSTLYTGANDGIAKTVDGGESWAPADAGLVASDVLSTATDPRNANVVYAGTPRGLFGSGDRGATWTPFKLGVSVQAISVDPANPARLLAAGSRGILLSTDKGRTWKHAAGSGNRTFSTIVFDPRHPETVFAAGQGARAIRSNDGGLTWRRTARRPGWIGSIVVSPIASGNLYGSFNGALISSTDGGGSWKWLFAHDRAVLAVLAVDPVNPQVIYASTGDPSSRLQPSQLAKTVDGGKHWHVLKAGTHDIDPTAVAIDPRDPRTLYVATQFQGVLRTTDGGAGWQPFSAGLLVRAITTLAFDRTGTTLYAGTNGAGVVRASLR